MEVGGPEPEVGQDLLEESFRVREAIQLLVTSILVG